MTRFHRFAFATAVTLPLTVAGGIAFAFSYTDGPPGYSDGSSFADPNAQFDAMSEHMSQTYDVQGPDYSELLTNGTGAASSTSSDPAVAPRLPTNIGGNR